MDVHGDPLYKLRSSVVGVRVLTNLWQERTHRYSDRAAHESRWSDAAVQRHGQHVSLLRWGEKGRMGKEGTERQWRRRFLKGRREKGGKEEGRIGGRIGRMEESHRDGKGSKRYKGGPENQEGRRRESMLPWRWSRICDFLLHSLRVWDTRPFVEGSRCKLVMGGHMHNYEKNLIRCAWSPDGECGRLDVEWLTRRQRLVSGQAVRTRWCMCGMQSTGSYMTGGSGTSCRDTLGASTRSTFIPSSRSSPLQAPTRRWVDALGGPADLCWEDLPRRAGADLMEQEEDEEGAEEVEEEEGKSVLAGKGGVREDFVRMNKTTDHVLACSQLVEKYGTDTQSRNSYYQLPFTMVLPCSYLLLLPPVPYGRSRASYRKSLVKRS
eukprot:766673-Hanusia_phi.AAC.8